MSIFFLRHTAVDVPPGLCYGRLDVPLAASYSQDRQPILQQISELSPIRIYSSPALRCRTLAEDIASLDNRFLCLDERLWELDFGLWEGRLWSQIHQDESHAWTEDFVHRAPPQGETYQALWLRLQDFLDELAHLAPTHPTLVVTHSGVIRAARCFAEGRDLREAFDFSLAFGQLWSWDQLR